MTRFARAKGSKASNERRPEEATSWSEMKKSLLLKKKDEVVEQLPECIARTENEERPSEWASLGSDGSEFLLKPNVAEKEKEKGKMEEKGKVRKKKKVLDKKKANAVSGKSEEEITERQTSLSDENEGRVRKRKKKKEKTGDDLEGVTPKKKKKMEEAVVELKNKKKKKMEEAVVEPKNKKKKKMEEAVVEPKNKKKKKMEEAVVEPKNKKKIKMEEALVEPKNKKKDKKIKMKGSEKPQERQMENFNKNENGRFQGKFSEKLKRKGFKKASPAVEELIINGEKIEIVKFQGFYVTKEDAERLKKLRGEMKKEGIPRAKLEAAIKLERRRAEKALSRLKKSVCFHCRGHGHLLSNCPELVEKESTGVGICYKCGSTEHSAAECKVVRGSSYQFAECFICKEQGHIARQCPDNPRGLYPQGGACRECGDVTHLRKDCPKVLTKKEEEAVTAGLRNDRNLECLDEEIVNREKRQNSLKTVKRNSTVKF